LDLVWTIVTHKISLQMTSQQLQQRQCLTLAAVLF